MSFYSPTNERPQQWLPWIALLATWALVHAATVAFRGVPGLGETLIDTDSYMRMVRVTELVQNWQWFDTTIERANAPYGDTLHWTRPFDIVILLIALPVNLVLDLDRSLYVAGYLVSPLLQLATALLLIWALQPVIRPDRWFLPALALFLQPCALTYSLLGRADHHALMLLVFVAVAGLMLRALCQAQDLRSPLIAGLGAGLGLWISVEFLLVVGVCLLALGLPWLLGERERAAQSKQFTLAMSVVLLIALFVERPPAQVLGISYDRISSVHYLLIVGILVFWSAAEALERRGVTLNIVARACLGAAGAAALAALVAGVYPLFFAGPMAEVDPRIVPLWLDQVREMRPLMPSDRQNVGPFILYLGGVLLIAPFFLKVLAREVGTRRFFAYLFIALACLLPTLAALSHVRFSGYPEVASVLAFAVVLDRFLTRTQRMRSDLLRGLVRGGFVSVMLVGPIFVGGGLMEKPTAAAESAGQTPSGCKVPAVAGFLENDSVWGAAPRTVLAFMDIGPELLYRTRHRVIGTPYHRNGDGIFDGHRILATGDLATAEALIRQRQIDLVLLCRSPVERSFYAAADGKDNLYARLDRGDAPDWLAAVELPATLSDTALLYRVVP